MKKISLVILASLLLVGCGDFKDETDAFLKDSKEVLDKTIETGKAVKDKTVETVGDIKDAATKVKEAKAAIDSISE
ncbi:MAG: hypothetical protein AAB373_01900 [Patescibacteria group bacterium]